MYPNRPVTSFVLMLLGALVTAGLPTALISGEPPQLTPRVIAVEQIHNTPLDWEGDSSIGLMITPQHVAAESFAIGALETPETILDILEQNRPDLSAEDRAHLAEMLETSLVGTTMYGSPESLTYIKKQDAPSKPYVYLSYNDGPLEGAEFAKAGSDGDVVELGAFRMRVKGPSDPFPPHVQGGQVYIVAPESPNYDRSFQIAIGLFK